MIRNVDDVVRYCQVDTDAADADKAASDTAHVSDRIREEVCAAINAIESDAPTEVRVPVEDLQPQATGAGDVEPALDAGPSAERSCADQSSTQPDFDLDSSSTREQLEVRAMSGKEPPPPGPELQEAGLNSTREMLDAVAEIHRLANAVVGAEQRIGVSVR